jgi:type VI secretion system protein ImpH
MAATSRDKNPPLERGSDSPEMEEVMRQDPFAFNFFQFVRLLSRLMPDRQPVGRFSDPRTEVVRFGVGAEIGFPPSQIAHLEWPEGSQPKTDVNFMGLTGPQGILPLYYSALIRERLRVRDRTMLAFFNIFNHRIISLFYRAWEKHHFTVGYERNEPDPVSPHIMDLLGLGTPGLSDRQAVSDESLLFRSGLLAAHCRSASGLRALLMDYFEVPVEIEQFVGQWHSIEQDNQCCFSETGSDSERLGTGTVVGDEIWDQQSGVLVRLGPLTLNRYLEFLPNGSAYKPLCSLIRFFSGNELDFKVQLVLKKEETPSCELGAEGPAAPRLGWLTWARTKAPEQDPDNSILQI